MKSSLGYGILLGCGIMLLLCLPASWALMSPPGSNPAPEQTLSSRGPGARAQVSVQVLSVPASPRPLAVKIESFPALRGSGADELLAPVPALGR